MKKTLAFGTLGDLLVLVLGPQPPTDADWERYMETWERRHKTYGRTRMIVYSEGGAPTTAQRHRLDERARGTGPGMSRVAIVTSSTFVRVVMNALASMDHAAIGQLVRKVQGEDTAPLYRGFDQKDMRQVLTWIECPAAREAEVAKLIESLKTEIDRL